MCTGFSCDDVVVTGIHDSVVSAIWWARCDCNISHVFIVTISAEVILSDPSSAASVMHVQSCAKVNPHPIFMNIFSTFCTCCLKFTECVLLYHTNMYPKIHSPHINRLSWYIKISKGSKYQNFCWFIFIYFFSVKLKTNEHSLISS